MKAPDLRELQRKYSNQERVFFTGEIGHSILPELYSSSDIFIFPSVTDTFGMAVLEAQSCGIPAIVSGKGGPKEIIIDGMTGFVVPEMNTKDWEEKIMYMINMIEKNYEHYKNMCNDSRDNVLRNYNWDRVIENIIEKKETREINKITGQLIPDKVI